MYNKNVNVKCIIIRFLIEKNIITGVKYRKYVVRCHITIMSVFDWVYPQGFQGLIRNQNQKSSIQRRNQSLIVLKHLIFRVFSALLGFLRFFRSAPLLTFFLSFILATFETIFPCKFSPRNAACLVFLVPTLSSLGPYVKLYVYLTKTTYLLSIECNTSVITFQHVLFHCLSFRLHALLTVHRRHYIFGIWYPHFIALAYQNACSTDLCVTTYRVISD